MSAFEISRGGLNRAPINILFVRKSLALQQKLSSCGRATLLPVRRQGGKAR
jgi:hypothetical protein